jgi:hypothetical protein
MASVFISHAEEDQAVALEIASGLERARYSTWYYERDSTPGPSYLLQVNQAIEACRFVVLVISARSLASNQVTAEVVRAHETGKAFVPVRVGISHEEFQRRRPEWNMAVGAATSIAIPAGGVSPILPEIVEGLGLLSAEGERVRTAPVETAATARRFARSALAWGAAGATVLALVVAGLNLSLSGGETAKTVPPESSASAAPAAPAAAKAGAEANAEPRCPDPSPGRLDVHERGRLEARDDPSDLVYAFVICEVRDTATSGVVMRIISASTTGTNWPHEAATRKAEDMERRGQACEPTGTPAVRSSGQNDPRHIVYVLCQQGGKPTSLEVHATTRQADGSAYPLKVLRAAWPE